MTISLRMGWRNLRRNPRRTAIQVAATAVAFAVLIVLSGLLLGSMRQLLESGTRLRSGHLQVHQAGYLPERSIYDTLGGDDGTDWRGIESDLAAAAGVAATAPRVQTAGLLSFGDRTCGATLLGVEPEQERRVTRLLDMTKSGSPARLDAPREIAVGNRLAERLAVDPGDEVAILTVAADGSLGYDLYRVRSILDTGLREVDDVLAVMRLEDLQGLMALAPERIHEIAARCERPEIADVVVGRIRAAGVLPGDAVVQSWGELNPMLRDYEAMAGASNKVVIALVSILAALSVFNTMSMAVYERTRELGMLSAIGTPPGLVIRILVTECLTMTLCGILAGFLLGALGIWWFAVRGWDLTKFAGSFSFAGAVFDTHLRAVWPRGEVGFAAVSLVVWGLLVTLLPAWRAVRLRPVAALRAPAGGADG